MANTLTLKDVIDIRVEGTRKSPRVRVTFQNGDVLEYADDNGGCWENGHLPGPHLTPAASRMLGALVSKISIGYKDA
jgi:hypothetical protein